MSIFSFKSLTVQIILSKTSHNYLKFTHSQIRELVENSGLHLWIGADDIGREGNFRFLNGTKFEPSIETLYDWGGSNPDNYGGEENCVNIFGGFSDLVGTLNDMSCDWDIAADDVAMRGLCEVKLYQNCITKL